MRSRTTSVSAPHIGKKGSGQDSFKRRRAGRDQLHMGSSMTRRQGGDERPTVAFDFDGTLTYRDSFMAFLAWRSGPLHYAAGLIGLAPAGLAYLGHRDRGRIKAAA